MGNKTHTISTSVLFNIFISKLTLQIYLPPPVPPKGGAGF